MILSSESEIIALQEVNQKVASKKVPLEQLTTFCPIATQTPIHEDNFAYLIVQYLAEKANTIIELGNEPHWLCYL